MAGQNAAGLGVAALIALVRFIGLPARRTAGHDVDMVMADL
jgi:hypothetical protein